MSSERNATLFSKAKKIDVQIVGDISLQGKEISFSIYQSIIRWVI